MAEAKRVLIIGENPDLIDFSNPAIPEGTTAGTVREGLEQALSELRSNGRRAQLLLTEAEDTAAQQTAEALGRDRFDVVVIGAGLRIVPKHARIFEIIMNIVHCQAPQSKLAFNTNPRDSAQAAERMLAE